MRKKRVKMMMKIKIKMREIRQSRLMIKMRERRKAVRSRSLSMITQSSMSF